MPISLSISLIFINRLAYSVCNFFDGPTLTVVMVCALLPNRGVSIPITPVSSPPYITPFAPSIIIFPIAVILLLRIYPALTSPSAYTSAFSKNLPVILPLAYILPMPLALIPSCKIRSFWVVITAPSTCPPIYITQCINSYTGNNISLNINIAIKVNITCIKVNITINL